MVWRAAADAQAEVDGDAIARLLVLAPSDRSSTQASQLASGRRQSPRLAARQLRHSLPPVLAALTLFSPPPPLPASAISAPAAPCVSVGSSPAPAAHTPRASRRTALDVVDDLGNDLDEYDADRELLYSQLEAAAIASFSSSQAGPSSAPVAAPTAAAASATGSVAARSATLPLPIRPAAPAGKENVPASTSAEPSKVQLSPTTAERIEQRRQAALRRREERLRELIQQRHEDAKRRRLLREQERAGLVRPSDL